MNISDYEKDFIQLDVYHSVPNLPGYKYKIKNNKFVYKCWEFNKLENLVKYFNYCNKEEESLVEEKFIKNLIFKHFKLDSPNILKYPDIDRIMENSFYKFKDEIINICHADKEEALKFFSSCVCLNLV